MAFIEKKIKQILKEKGIDYKEFDHEPVYTCEVAEKVRQRIENKNNTSKKNTSPRAYSI